MSHAHEKVKICDALPGETHLHDDEYLSHTCNLCDFTFPIFVFSLTTFQLSVKLFFFVQKEFSYLSLKPSHFHLLQSLRGPPVDA